MPDRNLNPFLIGMRTDLFSKQPYLKYLKVSSKFIKPCGCKQPVHTYCITADVIRSGCVSCSKCKQQYKLFVKEEQICSSKLITLSGIYALCIFVCMISFTGLVIIDAYTKYLYFQDNPDEASFASKRNNLLNIDVLPDYAN